MKKVISVLSAIALSVSAVCVTFGVASADTAKYLTKATIEFSSDEISYLTYAYDKNDNVVAEKYFVQSGDKYYAQTVETYKYDAKNNCIEDTTKMLNPSGEEMYSTTTSYEYNAAGKKTKIISEGSTTVFTYDASGNLLKKQEYAGDVTTLRQRTEYTYDGGKVSTEINYDAQGDETGKQSYVYQADKVTVNNYLYISDDWDLTEISETVTDGDTEVTSRYATVPGEENQLLSESTTTYNAQKKVVSIVGKEYDSGTSSLKVRSTEDYTYDAEGNITKKVAKTYYSDPENVQTTTFTYGPRSEAVVLSMLNGEEQQWKPGSNESLAFRSEAPLGEFIDVTVDGNVVDKKNYDLKEGSTIVSLHADFLESLPLGNHEIGIVSESGTASASFAVDNNADTSKNYKADGTTATTETKVTTTTASSATTTTKASTTTTTTKATTEAGESDDLVAPQTGDSTSIAVSSAILLLSIIGLAVFASRKKNTVVR